MTAATQSKAKAAAAFRAKNFDRALRLGLNGGGVESNLSPSAKTNLLKLEKEFLKEGSKLLNVIQTTQAELTKTAIDEEMKAMGVEAFQLDPPNNTTSTADNETALDNKNKSSADKKKTPPNKAKLTELFDTQLDLQMLELWWRPSEERLSRQRQTCCQS